MLMSECFDLKHQHDSAPANAKYTSKEIQNDLLDTAAKVALCKDVHAAHFFALIADESVEIF